MIHQLKTESKYFEDIISGKKSFEVRFNDRNFKVGDFLALNEVDESGPPAKTDRSCLVEVVYVLTDSRYAKAGYAVLGIRPCAIGISSDRMMIHGGRDRLYEVPVYGRKEQFDETGNDRN